MRRRFRHLAVVLLALACALVLLALMAAGAGQRVKRLILKDGTYQMATEWEVKGDRLRYYSAERGEWEELPNSLVDWPATEQWEKDHPLGAVSRETIAASAEDEAERQADEAKSPEVAPGLKLPDTGGVFLLDAFQRQEELAEVAQNGGQINANRGGNILRAVVNPFSGPKQSIELPGAHARVQSHLLQPALFVNVEETKDEGDDTAAAKPAKPEKPLTGGERFRIIRAESKKGVRVIGNLKVALTGKVSEQQSFVAVTAEALTGGWYKITPAAPLPAGEYALVEMLGPREMNLYVWDFGVDPNAPENGSAWKPASAGPTPPPAEKPALEKRPKD
ncbi:MAG TPA: hypothetical protein VE825_11255 [Terriglobales bacterium]|jgi:hypothetical protein|nr:hypothetical protein [Terriglobales bacterium]